MLEIEVSHQHLIQIRRATQFLHQSRYTVVPRISPGGRRYHIENLWIAANLLSTPLRKSGGFLSVPMVRNARIFLLPHAYLTYNHIDSRAQPQSRRMALPDPPGEDDTETTEHIASTVSDKIDEIIDERTATRFFDRYVAEMAVHMPAVVFPPTMTAHMLRKTRPILFLSILVAASVGMIRVETQEELNALLMETLSKCVIRYGGKSLELIQSLIVAVLWYRPPKRYEQMNFYQLTHIAAIMAVDIGMGKRINVPKASRPTTSSEQTTRMPKYMLNSSTVEARRTWLGTYFMCSK